MLNILEKKIKEIDKQLKIAEKSNLPIYLLIKNKIKLLDEYTKEFIKIVNKTNKDRTYELEAVSVIIKNYQILSELSKKVNMDSTIYENKIYDIRVKYFGKDYTDKTWGKSK